MPQSGITETPSDISRLWVVHVDNGYDKSDEENNDDSDDEDNDDDEDA